MVPNLPKITVVTVAFNEEVSIEKTIQSVIAQDYPFLEYIVIDGGSSDGTLNVINKYKKDINFLLSEADHGIYHAMNKGISYSTGEFIIFMNAGDFFASSDVLFKLFTFMDETKSDVIFGGWVRAPEFSECCPCLSKGLFNHQSILYKKSLHITHGLYINKQDLTTADYAFFMRLLNDQNVNVTESNILASVVDTTGISSGLHTFSQKAAIDFIYGKINKTMLIIMLLFHPVFFRIKKIIKCII